MAAIGFFNTPNSRISSEDTAMTAVSVMHMTASRYMPPSSFPDWRPAM